MARRPAPTTVRLDTDLLARIAALTPLLQATRYGDLGQLSQSKVLRLAIVRGLSALEAEVRPPAKSK